MKKQNLSPPPVRKFLPLRCFNEVDPLLSVAVCSPAKTLPKTLQDCKSVEFLSPVSQEKLITEHQEILEFLDTYGVETINLIDYLDPSEQKISHAMPNRMFVRDVAAVVKQSLQFGQSHIPSRQLEFTFAQNALRQFCAKKGIDLIDIIPLQDLETIEFGDLMILNQNALLLNVGNRTSFKSNKDFLSSFFALGFDEIGIISIPKETNIIHLDLTCNMMGEKCAVGFQQLDLFPFQIHKSTALKPQPLCFSDFLRRHGLEVHLFQPLKTIDFITNFIHLTPDEILINSENAVRLKNLRSSNHIKIHTLNMTNLEKGGGSIRCLTLPLHRSTV